MKGRDRFSPEEAAKIKGILRKVRSAPRSEQKRLRQVLRDEYDFYISDFDDSRQGFTADEFETLTRSGRITVT